jgi:hypothetical protein
VAAVQPRHGRTEGWRQLSGFIASLGAGHGTSFWGHTLAASRLRSARAHTAHAILSFLFFVCRLSLISAYSFCFALLRGHEGGVGLRRRIRALRHSGSGAKHTIYITYFLDSSRWARVQPGMVTPKTELFQRCISSINHNSRTNAPKTPQPAELHKGVDRKTTPELPFLTWP